ncbi:hypothetical protein F5X96DRAFT_51650 [Biscogniauxia mediterranea]|nr:hypothetical protein F5X96DRAFT_51650 [Biscogniauxia mediterranea]
MYLSTLPTYTVCTDVFPLCILSFSFFFFVPFLSFPFFFSLFFPFPVVTHIPIQTSYPSIKHFHYCLRYKKINLPLIRFDGSPLTLFLLSILCIPQIFFPSPLFHPLLLPRPIQIHQNHYKIIKNREAVALQKWLWWPPRTPSENVVEICKSRCQ